MTRKQIESALKSLENVARCCRVLFEGCEGALESQTSGLVTSMVQDLYFMSNEVAGDLATYCRNLEATTAKGSEAHEDGPIL